MENIQFAYLGNAYCVFVTPDRDLLFIHSNSKGKTTQVINPDLAMFRFILTADDCDIRDNIKCLIRDLLTQVPADCGVLSAEAAKLRVLHNGVSSLNTYVEKVYKKYASFSDDDLVSTVYYWVTQVVNNLPQSLFKPSEGGI